tara:strand:+ start:4625 stop:5218 length:594 start_codon:yes stop_codon:yes gene_type:complete
VNLSLFSIPAPLRERIREAICELHAEDERLSVRRVRERSGGSTDHVSVLLRAARAGFLSIHHPWDGRLPVLDLEHAIRTISSHDDRTRIHQEIAAQLAAGTLGPSIAKALQDSLNAARLSAKAASEDGGTRGDHEPVHLVDHSTFLLARVVNRIVSPKILDEVMAFVLDAAERDLHEFPNATLAEVQRLASDGGPSQ